MPASLPWETMLGLRVHELSHVLERGMPVSPNHPPFQMALLRRHGDMVRPDGGSGANELIVTGGHTGTHLDGLAHVSQDGRLHGGVDTSTTQSDRGFAVLGIETVAAIVCRGVLLDIAAVRGVDILPPGAEVTVDDLERATSLAGTRPRTGDAILIRTGWAANWSRASTFVGQEAGAPGPGEPAAKWLAAHRPRVVGAETIALEMIPPGVGHRTLPVHRILLVEHGILLLEAMDLSTLAASRVYESLFVCLPLRIRGATGSPVRPIALAP
jgi:kynurenine formamidase